MAIRVSTLGSVGVERDGEPLGSLPGKPVTFGLLVYLALEGKVTRDRAAAVFWPESDTERARANLSQTLYELKQDLGEEWIAKQGNFLSTTDVVWVDAHAFQAHLEEGRHDEAVSLYHGPFLDGAFLAQTHPFEEWVDHRRGHLRRLHREALEGYIQECRRRGEVEKALATASTWVGADPLCEAGQHFLIRLLAEAGSRDEAIGQYERYAALLAEELGLKPLEETRNLVEAIKAQRVGPVRLVSPDPGASGSSPSTALTGMPDAGAVDGPITDRVAFRRMIERELAPRLQILRPIERGSMADVFLARDPALRCLVAVKFLSPEHYGDAAARKRFTREAQSMARLGLHPNVCDVKWVDTLKDGTPYFVMPFIKGTTLAQRVKAEGRLTPSEVRVVLLEVASALAAAHRRGIVHRDVRPDNILREEETGKNILSDFGIAGVLETGDEQNPKITRTGEFLGDPAFISPEQLDERPLTDRSDIYSLGVTGYQLLTGHTPPPEEATAGRQGKRVVNALATYAEGLSAVDRRLVELIIRCLAKDPGHRPTATDIVRRLKQDVIEANRNDDDNPDEENIVKIIFQKRLPQILLGYIAAAWMVLEFTQYLVDRLFLHPLAESLVLATIPFGFLAATILGWFHGKKGRQEITPAEGWLLAALGVAWAGVSAWILFASLPGG